MAKKIKQELIDRLKGKKTEPSANLKTRVDLIKALNQYHLSYERDDARKWIIDYCNHHNLYTILNIVKDKDFIYSASICSLGFCCRLNMRGASNVITDEMIQQKLAQIKPKKKEEKKTITQHRPNPLGIIYDTAYDTTIDTLKPQEIKLEGLSSDINDVLRQAKQDLDDVQGFPEEYDKRVVKPLTLFLQSVIGQKPVRKVVQRTPKPKPPSKLVARLRYQKEHSPLGLKSISPEKIIGASELYVYDVDKRQLSYFVSDTRLSVNGINITDYNPEKSFAVTIRKPEEMFALPPTHRTLASKLKTIKSVKKSVRQRLTETSILISVK